MSIDTAFLHYYIQTLEALLREQQMEGVRLNAAIAENLKALGLGDREL
ncbi:MAG: hypothetical protein M2R45_02567 [Verrucomicrobia subdivision 3 bacterium]|nr:hypothetical protein [Limisphaerales bacterium]MCS1414226.1 hypothetical protein [Limisphaerales bacterium]